MAVRTPDVVVIGAGVVGLTTGICLAEAGLRVLIRTAAWPADTTSAVAGALIGPTFTAPGHPAGGQVADWERTGVAEFTGLATDPGTGVHVGRGLLAARPAAVADGTPPLDEVPQAELCRTEELPDGFAFGFWATLPLVANCTGVGARDLVPDPSVRPVRGQHVVVANPGIETFFLEAPLGPSWTAYLPHGDRVVLGGVAGEDDWSTEPNPATAAAILRRCADVEPRLADAEVIAHTAGLRPARPSVRLETARIDGVRCVHNYGHGGSGVALSWATARAAADLLLR